MNCGVTHRRGSDPVWLWLWCRLAVAALIRPLAWEPPYAAGAALNKQTKEAGCTYTEERPREDTAGRWPSARQGEGPQDKPNLPHLDLGLQTSRTVGANAPA